MTQSEGAHRAKYLPYYPLYVNDFDESPNVMSMSLAEVGLYTLALNESWKRGSIPDDPKALATVIRKDPKEVRKAWAAVRARYIFSSAPGRLVNKRQEEERTKAASKSLKAANAARSRYSGTADAGADALAKEPAKPMPRASDSDSGVGFEVGLDSSKKDGPQIEVFQRFEIVKRRHPGAVTRPNACREKYKELVVESTDQDFIANEIDRIQLAWIAFWKETKQRPLGLLNYLFDGDCLTEPPALPTKPKSMMEGV